MKSFLEFLFCGYVLVFGNFINSETTSTAILTQGTSLTCNQNMGIIFQIDNRVAQVGGNTPPRKVLQHQLFVGIMEKVTISAKAKGINCTFNKQRNILTCGETDKFQSVDRKWWTPYQKIWNYEISKKNLVLFLVNLLFFVYMIGCAVVLILKCLVTSTPVGQNQSNVSTQGWVM